MVKIICNNDILCDEKIEYKSEDGSTILTLENKSNILGVKTAVYKNEQLVYFIDEDITSDFNEVSILQDTSIVARLRRSNNLVMREIVIETDEADYEFLFIQGVLLKNGQKIAVIRHHSPEGNTFTDNDKIKKINAEIKSILEKRRVIIQENLKIPQETAEKINEKREEIKEKISETFKLNELKEIRNLNREIMKNADGDQLSKLYNSGIIIEVEDDENIEYILSLIFTIQLLMQR